MVLAKADPKISTLYDKVLVQPELWPLGEELRQRCARVLLSFAITHKVFVLFCHITRARVLDCQTCVFVVTRQHLLSHTP